MMAGASGAYAFGEFRLDPARRILERDGSAVTLTAKAFDLLLVLVERNHEVVTKDDLLTAVWPDTTVEENNLTVTMSAVRKALGEQRGDHRFIVTLPGKGYRFVAPVQSAAGARSAGGPPRGNLPGPVNSFVGRVRERAEILRLIAEHRLVTVSGTGGCGKTRLAIEVGREIAVTTPDGVWLVELAPLSDPNLVAQTVAATLAVREDSAQPALKSLVAALTGKAPVLILDNCEHLVDACARLTEALLAQVPGLRVVVTSREPLVIAGEAVWRVPPLSVPVDAVSARDAAACEAVQLFADRASAMRSGWTLTDAEAIPVANICRRLDGIPLAIELAAARVAVATASQIAERLDDQFRVLTRGARTALPQHRTLKASIDWSHALLSADEQALFRRLSVFYRGWTLDAAEAIASDDGPERSGILDGLSSLVHKSLAIWEPGPDETGRYRMLETVREYARERLSDSGEEERVRNRHLCFFVDMVKRAEAEMAGPAAPRWAQRLSIEHDNLRSAMDWALGRDAESSLRLVGGLRSFWAWRGDLREATERVELALQRAGSRGSDEARARAFQSGASIALFRGDLNGAATHAESCLELSRRSGIVTLEAYSLLLIALRLLYHDGDFARAVPMLEQGLSLARSSGDQFLVALLLVNLGFPALLQGDLARAETLLTEGLAVAEQTRNPWMCAAALLNSGLLALGQGQVDRAEALCRRSLSLRIQSADRWGIIQSLEAMAEIALANGNAIEAARFLGASGALGDAIGAAVPVFTRAAHERTTARVRDALGDARFEAEWAEGARMPLDAFALS